MAEKTQPPLVVHLLHRFDVGGLENGVVNLINGLSPLAFRHVIICLTQSSDFCRRLEHPVPIYELNKQPGKDPATYLRLLRLLRKLQPDILHTRNLATLEGQFWGWLAGVKHRVHGEHGWDMADLQGDNPRYRRLRRWMRPLVNHYIALADHQTEYLRREVGVEEERITTIRNGVDTKRFRPAEVQDPPVRDIPVDWQTPGQVTFGTVGRLAAVKDQQSLLEAYIQCAQNADFRQRARLMIVGDGELLQTLQQQVRDAELESQVWFTGNRDDVPELLRLMDVFVLPSLAEGICNTILEAMASGVPVIATNVGGNPELVQPGLTGSLVPARDVHSLAAAMRRYLLDTQARDAQRIASRRHALAEFSLSMMVDSYTGVYQRLLGNPLEASRSVAG